MLKNSIMYIVEFDNKPNEFEFNKMLTWCERRYGNEYGIHWNYKMKKKYDDIANSYYVDVWSFAKESDALLFALTFK